MELFELFAYVMGWPVLLGMWLQPHVGTTGAWLIATPVFMGYMLGLGALWAILGDQ